MEFISWELDGKTAVITMNRPPANALSFKLLEELDQTLTDLEKNQDVWVIVLRGEGRFFSAGADIKEFTTIATQEEAFNLARNGQTLLDRIEEFSKPVIASIHGVAFGGGLELAMSCHLRVAAESAKLGLPELQLGIIPGFSGTQRLSKYVGIPKALEMMLTAEPITAGDALKLGLVNQVYPEEELFEKTMELAKKIEKKSPNVVSAVLKLVNYVKSSRFAEGSMEEARLFGEVFTKEDAKEGIQAFIEKREPNFKGK